MGCGFARSCRGGAAGRFEKVRSPARQIEPIGESFSVPIHPGLSWHVCDEALFQAVGEERQVSVEAGCDDGFVRAITLHVGIPDQLADSSRGTRQ